MVYWKKYNLQGFRSIQLTLGPRQESAYKTKYIGLSISKRIYFMYFAEKRTSICVDALFRGT